MITDNVYRAISNQVKVSSFLFLQTDPNGALRWRLLLRETIQHAFEDGFVIRGFVPGVAAGGELSAYVIERREKERDLFLMFENSVEQLAAKRSLTDEGFTNFKQGGRLAVVQSRRASRSWRRFRMCG